MSRFSDRLESLGFGTYAEYLASDHWHDFKKRYRESGQPTHCAICGSKSIQLHHHTYERLGSEQPEDVTPLCREHHVAVHDWLKTNRKPVDRTPSALAAIQGRTSKTKGKTRKEKRAARIVANRARKAACAVEATIERIDELISRLNGSLLTLSTQLAELVRAGKVDVVKAWNVIRNRDHIGVRSAIHKAEMAGPRLTRKQRQKQRIKEGNKNKAKRKATVAESEQKHLLATNKAANALRKYRTSPDPATAIVRSVLQGRPT